MKISELSKRSDTSVATIKYYIREGVLPKGEATSRTQAIYGEAHLERLDLIKRLKDDAGLSLSTIANVLSAIDGTSGQYQAMGAGLDASGRSLLGRAQRRQAETGSSKGNRIVLALNKKHKWGLRKDDTALMEAAQAIDVILEGWPFELPPERFEDYAAFAIQLAMKEIPEEWDEGLTDDGELKFVLLGTFLFEPLILSLRRVAHRARMLQSLSGRSKK